MQWLLLANALKPAIGFSFLTVANCFRRLLELSSDPTIRSHLAALYDTLLQQNLLRIIEPYSTVDIAHVAEVVGQDRQAVESKCVLFFFRPFRSSKALTKRPPGCRR